MASLRTPQGRKTIDTNPEPIYNDGGQFVIGTSLGDLVSADLRSTEPSSYRGCLDGFEPETGLLGWAVDLRAPSESLSLRFLVDGMIVLDVTTAHPRPDISAAIGERDIQPGFCIPSEQLRRLVNLIALRPTAEFGVEIGTTSLFLPRKEILPTLQAAVSSLVERERSARQEPDVLKHLIQISRDAEPLTLIPLRPFDETRTGFIEVICAEDQSDAFTWVVGWTSGADLDEVPIVFVDGRKYHGAILAYKYPRADLPPGAMGFVGIVHSKWRAHRASQPILYYGLSLRHHLLSVPDLPRVSKQEILQYIERHRNVGDRAGWTDLRQILTRQNSWIAGSGYQPELKAGVDRLLLIPKFGFFISGWVLSYIGAVDGFALRVGSSAMSMDRTSLMLRPRPDLISAFPGSASLTERAGFTCFFPGDPDPSNLEKPLLKIFLEHGFSTILPVEAAHIRLLGHSEPLDSLIHLYPSLETEGFFPLLATAVRQDYLDRFATLDVAEIRGSKKALVLAVPSTRDDCFLIFDEIRHNAPHHLGPDTGLIFLASYASKHGEVELLFRELSGELPTPCSLVFVREITVAFYVLRDILLMAGVERFCFVAANDILTQDGWKAAAKFLRLTDNRAVAFESIDPETLLKSRNKALSFGCDWDTFSQLSSRLEVEIESQPSPLDFLSGIPKNLVELVEAGTFFTRVAMPSRVARLINLSGKEAARAFVS